MNVIPVAGVEASDLQQTLHPEERSQHVCTGGSHGAVWNGRWLLHQREHQAASSNKLCICRRKPSLRCTSPTRIPPSVQGPHPLLLHFDPTHVRFPSLHEPSTASSIWSIQLDRFCIQPCTCWLRFMRGHVRLPLRLCSFPHPLPPCFEGVYRGCSPSQPPRTR